MMEHCPDLVQQHSIHMPCNIVQLWIICCRKLMLNGANAKRIAQLIVKTFPFSITPNQSGQSTSLTFLPRLIMDVVVFHFWPWTDWEHTDLVAVFFSELTKYLAPQTDGTLIGPQTSVWIESSNPGALVVLGCLEITVPCAFQIIQDWKSIERSHNSLEGVEKFHFNPYSTIQFHWDS